MFCHFPEYARTLRLWAIFAEQVHNRLLFDKIKNKYVPRVCPILYLVRTRSVSRWHAQVSTYLLSFFRTCSARRPSEQYTYALRGFHLRLLPSPPPRICAQVANKYRQSVPRFLQRKSATIAGSRKREAFGQRKSSRRVP